MHKMHIAIHLNVNNIVKSIINDRFDKTFLMKIQLKCRVKNIVYLLQSVYNIINVKSRKN